MPFSRESLDQKTNKQLYDNYLTASDLMMMIEHSWRCIKSMNPSATHNQPNQISWVTKTNRNLYCYWVLVRGHKIFGFFHGNHWTRRPKIAVNAADAAVGRFSSISRCMAQSTPKRLIAPFFPLLSFSLLFFSLSLSPVLLFLYLQAILHPPWLIPASYPPQY